MENTSREDLPDFNMLPDSIRESAVFTRAHLNALALRGEIPVVDPAYTDQRQKAIVQYYSINPEEMERELQLYAAQLLDNGEVHAAWQVLLTIN